MKGFDISLWEKLQEEKLAEREERRKKILTDITISLKRYFSSKKVAKVFIIGSILRKGAFYNFSDIDIAVEGLDEDYFLTLSEIEALLDRDVDLIELEGHRLREEIKKRGMRIK
jgi:predicted nucleotidyltransferase